MLNERQLELLAERIFMRLNSANNFYLETIGRRLGQVGRLNDQEKEILRNIAMWQITDIPQIKKKLLQESNIAKKEIDEILNIVAEDVLNEVKPVYKAKGFDFVALQENKMLYGLVLDIAEATKKNIDNITKTTAIEESFKTALNEASTKVSLGMQNYDTAIESVCRDLADKGIYNVTYDKDGKIYRRRVDTSARQNILTSMKECNIKMSERLARELDADSWEISYHANPRPTHRDMGGSVYTKREFEEQGIQQLLDDFNCLHFKFPFWQGISERSYSPEQLTKYKSEDMNKIEVDGKMLDKYEISQIQRRLETEIRKKSELLLIAKSSKNKGLELKTKGQITELKSSYKKISKKAGLPVKVERYKLYTE